ARIGHGAVVHRARLPDRRRSAMMSAIGAALNRSFRYWSLVPAIVLFVALTVYPIVNLLRMSVSTIEFAEGHARWSFTPSHNFALLAHDAVLGAAVRNTAIFVVVAVVAEVLIGLLLALLVARLDRGKGFARTIMILPILVPPVAIGSMWKLMYNYDFGVFNQALVALGASP